MTLVVYLSGCCVYDKYLLEFLACVEGMRRITKILYTLDNEFSYCNTFITLDDIANYRTICATVENV